MKIYNDERDLLLVQKTKSNNRIYEKKYLSKRRAIPFILYNNITYKKHQLIKYLKISHCIEGREVEVFEFYELDKYYSTILKLRGLNSDEKQSLFVCCVFSNLEKPCFYNISTSLKATLNKKCYHFQFKNGNIHELELFKDNRYDSSILKYIVFIFLFIILIIYYC